MILHRNISCTTAENLILVKNVHSLTTNTNNTILLRQIALTLIQKVQKVVQPLAITGTKAMHTLSKVVSLGAVVLLLGACASTADLEKVKASAASAQTTADEAKTTADEAKTMATDASDTANRAMRLAEQANSTANQALGAAQGAQATADSALSEARTAREEAQQASEKADRMYQKAVSK